MGDELKFTFAIALCIVTVVAIITIGLSYSEISVKTEAIKAGLVQEATSSGQIIWVKPKE